MKLLFGGSKMEVNPIIGASSILFLGAGASKPLGKMLMGEFVNWFRHKNDPKGFARPILAGSRSELLDALCETKLDLEFLIDELESLSSKQYLENRTRPVYLRGDSLSSGEPSKEQVWPEFSKLAGEAKFLLADLKKEVYLHYRAIDNPSNLALLSKILKMTSSPTHPMVVFTTNYDPAVEDLCADLKWTITDGFVDVGRTYVWNRNAFEKPASPLETSLVLFKLHGSASWAQNRGRIVRSLPFYAGADPDYINVMIYPATSKVAIKEPFFTAYDYLEKCLTATCLCLVIGYSFRDYDALMRFKSASLQNPRLKVAILDPSAEEICKELVAHGVRAVPVCYALGDEKFETEYLRKVVTLCREAELANMK
jgi:hypothetical protein